jgi:adenylate cyclase
MDFGRTYIDVVIGGEDRAFDLTELASLSIGRHPQCTVVLTGDANVSRKHALIQREGSGEYYLSDLGSRNGTTRNGVPVTTPVPLRDGDSFMIGSHRFVFHQASLRVGKEEDALQAPTDVLVVERMITIMVLDIRNYTGLARELGEARISELMNRLFHESGQLLKRNGSWAQKYIGDAVMSIWVHESEGGTPREVGLLFRSLVELSELIARLNTEFSLPRPLAFGAGVNSGLAVTGNMGSAGLADHTAMGDAVNKAFRLETACKEVACGLVLGAQTFALLPEVARALFQTHTVHLKGYDAPEAVYGLHLDELPRLVDALGH